MTRYLIFFALGALYLEQPAASAAEPDERILELFAAELVPITPGEGKFPKSFQMGSKSNANEAPVHTVKLSKPFAMARYEVTQELYETVMGKNPSKWKGKRNSVEMVSWQEANEFCRKATLALRKHKLIKNDEVIRLPTEAEWEYCCRAGTTSPFSFGAADQINEYAWHKGNSKGEDPPVGAKKPNPWGLYDLHGYVWEWCLDEHHQDYRGAPADGTARADGKTKERVLRSGAWNVAADQCRSASRSHQPLDHRKDDVGFRCVRASK